MKFKPGDKVMILNVGESGSVISDMAAMEGKICEVKEIRDDYSLYVWDLEHKLAWAFAADWVRLVNTDTKKKIVQEISKKILKRL